MKLQIMLKNTWIKIGDGNMPNKNSVIFIDDKSQIETFVENRSQDMKKYMQDHENSRFTAWYKRLTHSDLTNRGKRNGPGEGLERNLLYYLSLSEMQDIEKHNGKKFECAKQSNIGLCEEFYEDLGIPRLQRRIGPQKTQHEHIILNETTDVYLVNDTLEYFTMDYTKKVLDALGKEPVRWSDEDTVTLDKSAPFTPIQLTEAIHGLGTKDDKQFHKLRLSMFLNDAMTFIIEHNESRNKLFILLEKNPKFFKLANISDKAWEEYLSVQKNQELNGLQAQQSLETDDEMSRKLQSVWKDKLAKEMMNYSVVEGNVFCPITGISANYNAFSMLFIASHIKRHSDCATMEESFDINNGLLLAANADALFDKHMFTIGEDKEIIFSFLLKNNYELQNKLLLNQPIFNIILNDKRMEMLKFHREEFYKKEEDRKRRME